MQVVRDPDRSRRLHARVERHGEPGNRLECGQLSAAQRVTCQLVQLCRIDGRERALSRLATAERPLAVFLLAIDRRPGDAVAAR